MSRHAPAKSVNRKGVPLRQSRFSQSKRESDGIGTTMKTPYGVTLSTNPLRIVRNTSGKSAVEKWLPEITYIDYGPATDDRPPTDAIAVPVAKQSPDQTWKILIRSPDDQFFPDRGLDPWSSSVVGLRKSISQENSKTENKNYEMRFRTARRIW